LPSVISLEQNYPNPFNPNTNISFELTRHAHAVLEVFNILGQPVTRLIDDHLSSGLHTVRWDGRDNSGEAVSSGVYFYRLRVTDGDEQLVRKMVLVK
jgi:flagellar hook assembly protein FlgD